MIILSFIVVYVTDVVRYFGTFLIDVAVFLLFFLVRRACNAIKNNHNNTKHEYNII